MIKLRISKDKSELIERITIKQDYSDEWKNVLKVIRNWFNTPTNPYINSLVIKILNNEDYFNRVGNSDIWEIDPSNTQQLKILKDVVSDFQTKTEINNRKMLSRLNLEDYVKKSKN
jgi:hypothetical protein